MRISDWSSDVCSSDLHEPPHHMSTLRMVAAAPAELGYLRLRRNKRSATASSTSTTPSSADRLSVCDPEVVVLRLAHPGVGRSEEHTSELQSLLRTSYAVSCLTQNTTTSSQMLCSSTLL